MANVLTAVTPKLLAQGLLALRQNAVMPRLVNRAYESMAGMKGSTIDVPIPSAITVQDVTPSNIPPNTSDVQPTSVPIVMSQWKEAPFYLTDQDLLIAMDGTIPMQASEAIKAIANNVDQYLLALFTSFYGFVGTPGTTPLAADTSDATKARAVLARQLAPLDDRHIVMNPDMEANALNLRAFQDVSWSGSPDAILDGQLNQKLGFRWWMNQNVPSFTNGTITTSLVNKSGSAAAVGATTITAHTAASTGACALVIGDIFTIAGQTQTYVLTAAATQAAANTDVTLTFQPPLVVALVGSEAITVKTSGAAGAASTWVNNLAFHRDAIAFASRPLQGLIQDGLGAIAQSAVDPVSGLALRLEITREHKRTRYSYDILYGASVVRAALGCRIAG